VKEDVGGEPPEEQDRQRRRVGGGSGERPWIRREKIRGGRGGSMALFPESADPWERE
jgi:hypothetical protein